MAHLQLSYSAADLVSKCLPNLPKTPQGIAHRAKQENWAFELVAGKGRGGQLKLPIRKFKHINKLPKRRPNPHKRKAKLPKQLWKMWKTWARQPNPASIKCRI